MPFGIKDGPAYRQTFMQSIIGHLEYDYAIIYLHEIIVYSPNPQQHEKDLV
jgi:hypothetical protein